VASPLQRYWLLNLFTCPTVTAILFIRQWMKLTCQTGDSWLFGGVVESVTALAPIQKLNSN
jgi:hypothetical protein